MALDVEVASRDNLRLINKFIGKVEWPLINCYFVICTISRHFQRQTGDATAQHVIYSLESYFILYSNWL